MTDRTFWRLFLARALWNLLGAGPFFVFWRQARAFFYLKPPHYLAFFQAWLALAFVFGIGYYMFREFYRNLHIVRLEIYGKTVFAVIFIYHIAFGNVHPVFLCGTGICLVFVVLYALFLAHARRREVKSQGSAQAVSVSGKED